MQEENHGGGFVPPSWIKDDFDFWWAGMAWDGHRSEAPVRVRTAAGKRNREADELAAEEAATRAMAEQEDKTA